MISVPRREQAWLQASMKHTRKELQNLAYDYLDIVDEAIKRCYSIDVDIARAKYMRWLRNRPAWNRTWGHLKRAKRYLEYCVQDLVDLGGKVIEKTLKVEAEFRRWTDHIGTFYPAVEARGFKLCLKDKYKATDALTTVAQLLAGLHTEEEARGLRFEGEDKSQDALATVSQLLAGLHIEAEGIGEEEIERKEGKRDLASDRATDLLRLMLEAEEELAASNDTAEIQGLKAKSDTLQEKLGQFREAQKEYKEANDALHEAGERRFELRGNLEELKRAGETLEELRKRREECFTTFLEEEGELIEMIAECEASLESGVWKADK
ncbi:hypothetical protein BJ508DRAFT_329427 [Ascobolus immersus RN42]|uniref:Uncharacterized protein n=1 Tax=Ascobolus immersus RN42 TaxID=1160509 RepID=A0A3N4I251_ASCIM|nr:hypothetical protein BJ508DRAFT_329427 [Ascobolus immersus RN42]